MTTREQTTPNNDHPTVQVHPPAVEPLRATLPDGHHPAAGITLHNSGWSISVRLRTTTGAITGT